MTKEFPASTIQYRPASIEDFDQLVILFRQMWPDKPIDPERLRAVYAKVIASSHKHCLCAVDAEKMIGTGIMSFKDSLWQEGEVAYVDILVVDQKYHGRGIGTQLLDRLTSVAREHGCPRIELDSGFHREASHRFYEQRGLEKRGYVFGRALKALQPLATGKP